MSVDVMSSDSDCPLSSVVRVCATPLEATRLGLLDELQRLVEEGHALDVGDTRGCRPLHQAARNGQLDCLNYLLERDDTDVDWKSFEGITALNVGCTEGHVQAVERLLESGASPNLCDHVNTFPLLNAVKANSLDIIKLLLDFGAKIDVQLYCGTTPLHQASAEGQVEIVQHLLDRGADLTVHEDYGITPLFSAAQYGQEGCCRVLLDKCSATGRADVVDMAADDGATPLYLAAQEGYRNIVTLLLERGASANVCTQQPVAMPLHAALQFDHLECVKLLLPHMELKALDKCDVSPFYFSMTAVDPCCTEALIKGGIPPSRRHCVSDGHRYGPRVLHYFQGTVKYSRRISPLVELVMNSCSTWHAQVLLDSGACPDARTPYEAPPLLVALEHKRYDLAQELIRSGASVDVYHPKIIGNMALLVTYCHWYGLNIMLQCGAEARSLFQSTQVPRTPLSPVRQRLVELEDDLSEIGEDDYENEVSILRYPIPFWRILAENRMDGSRVGMAQVLHRILQFVGCVHLDPHLRSYVDKDEEWRELCRLTESPRMLTQLCRVRIRVLMGPQRLMEQTPIKSLMGPQRLMEQTPIKSLPLPEPVIDFLLYTDLAPHPDFLAPHS